MMISQISKQCPNMIVHNSWCRSYRSKTKHEVAPPHQKMQGRRSHLAARAYCQHLLGTVSGTSIESSTVQFSLTQDFTFSTNNCINFLDSDVMSPQTSGEVVVPTQPPSSP